VLAGSILLCVLVAVLLGLTRSIRDGGDTRAVRTRVEIARIQTGLEVFRDAVGHYPTDAEGSLQALLQCPAHGSDSWRGPYVDPDNARLSDYWERPLRFRLLDPNSYELRSSGPDGQPGTSDDIVVTGGTGRQ